MAIGATHPALSMRLGRRLLLGTALLTLPISSVYAQDSQVDEPVLDQSAETAPDAATIVVTGSRIGRRDYRSNSPISTINSSVLATSGQPSLDKAIGELPQFSAAQGRGRSWRRPRRHRIFGWTIQWGFTRPRAKPLTGFVGRSSADAIRARRVD